MEPVNETPLSDLMTVFAADQTPESFTQFVAAFRRSKVGVIVVGTSAGFSGEVTSNRCTPHFSRPERAWGRAGTSARVRDRDAVVMLGNERYDPAVPRKPNLLVVDVPAGKFKQPASVDVSVRNPDDRGGVSQPKAFDVK